jgi:outer membrane protein TolC
MQRILVGILSLLCCLGSISQAAEEKMAVADLSKIKVLDLRTAQSLALAGNPTMEASRARVEQAKAQVSQAAAAWWPSLDVSGSGANIRLSESSYQQNRGLAALLGGNADQTTDRYSAGVQATWVLFDGFYRNFKEQQAAFDEQSVAAALIDSRRLLVTSVAEAFLNAQLAQTRVDIARADEAFYTRQLEDAQNRFNVGAGPWGDVLNIKVQLNTARTGLMLYQREFEAAGYGLAALLGLPDAEFPAHVRMETLDRESATKGQQKTPEVLIKEALAARPDVRRLEMVVKQAEAAKGVAKAPFYPKVQVGGAVEGAREGDAGLTTDDFGNTVAMNMSWNLYAGGGDKARMIEAEQAKREAVYTLAGLRNSVAAEIRQDLALLAAAQEQVRLQRETVKLVQENRDLAKNEYEAGEASLVRLNEAQRDLTTTYGRLAQALVSYQLAMQRLLSATGQNLAAFDPPAQKK